MSLKLGLLRKDMAWGFHDTIPKVVNTMSFPRKHIKLEKSKVFDTEIIYARAMTLQATSRGIDTENLLAHELAPFPTSMFDADGHMRESKHARLTSSPWAVIQ